MRRSIHSPIPLRATPVSLIPTGYPEKQAVDQINSRGTSIMGKYFLGWLLGVPVIGLVIIYLLFN